MKNIFCSHSLNAAAVAALLFAAGCVGSGEQSGTEAENDQSGALSVTVTAEPAPSSKPAEKAVLLNSRKDLLRLIVQSEASSTDEKSFATDIVQRTQGTLASSDARIITDGKCDVRVSIHPKLTIVDQDGEYYRMNGSVDVKMTSADGQRIYGTNKIEVSAPRRILGKDAAIAGLAEPAASKTSDWCRRELNRIVDAEVGATILSVQLPSVPGEKRDAQKDAAVIKVIGDEIAKMPNLVTYELSSHDSQTGTCQYRVVYFISKYPNGIANEVSVLLGKVKQK